MTGHTANLIFTTISSQHMQLLLEQSRLQSRIASNLEAGQRLEANDFSGSIERLTADHSPDWPGKVGTGKRIRIHLIKQCDLNLMQGTPPRVGKRSEWVVATPQMKRRNA